MCLNLRHDDIAEPLLAVCTGLGNLSIDLPDLKKLPPLIAPLLLKRLHAPLNPLFREFPPNHQFFALITHLGLTWADRLRLEDPEYTRRLALMPQLTHLSFDSGAGIPIYLRLPETCRLLTVLVVFAIGASAEPDEHHLSALSRDPRFVMMGRMYSLKDWQMGAHAGIDYWTRAEDFISKQRSGEIDGVFSVVLELRA
jgi:hypothetical protein